MEGGGEGGGGEGGGEGEEEKDEEEEEESVRKGRRLKEVNTYKRVSPLPQSGA